MKSTTTSDPATVQKGYRAFLRREGIQLKAVGLAQVFGAAEAFYRATHGSYKTLAPDGDGLAFSVEVDGPHLAVHINRLLRLTPSKDELYVWPAIRLWTTMRYKFDMNVIQFLHRSGQSSASGSFVSWSPTTLDSFTDTVKESDAYKTFSALKPSEVRVVSDEWGYNKHAPHPSPADGPWWGSFDVR